MFSKTTANFVQQYDRGGTLIEARLNDSDKLVPMALVIKKKRQWWQQKSKYCPCTFTLNDLLRGESTDPPLSPGFTETDFGSFEGSVTETGALGVIGGILKGDMNKHTSYNLSNLKKQRVDINKLHKNSSNSVDMLVQRLKKKGDVLALLTERIITSSTCHLSEHRDTTGIVKVSKTTVPVTVINQDCVDGKLKLKKQDSMDIPPNTVIAYSLRVLKFREDGCFDWYDTVSDDGIQTDAFIIEEEELAPDSTVLQELPPRSDLFQKFCELMKDRDALCDVENTLEEWCSGDAAVETEQDLSEDLSSLSLSVCHCNSASAILDLLRPYLTTRRDPDSHSESDGSPGGPLAAVHLLVSTMEELPDEALTLLSESSPDVLKAFNALLKMIDLKDQKESCSLPKESVPLPLQDDKAFHWMQQLLITCNVTLSREAGGLSAERESNAGVLPLVLCITVQGLSYLCAQQN